LPSSVWNAIHRHPEVDEHEKQNNARADAMLVVVLEAEIILPVVL
jgi:hypothetical protein